MTTTEKTATWRRQVGERVLLRRRQLHWTQRELASRVGCPWQVVSGLERGRQSVRAERLAALALALDVSADYLLGLPARGCGAQETQQHDG
jgi:transcriptional regulator with XRE-family HTH domain